MEINFKKKNWEVCVGVNYLVQNPWGKREKKK